MNKRHLSIVPDPPTETNGDDPTYARKEVSDLFKYFIKLIKSFDPSKEVQRVTLEQILETFISLLDTNDPTAIFDVTLKTNLYTSTPTNRLLITNFFTSTDLHLHPASGMNLTLFLQCKESSLRYLRSVEISKQSTNSITVDGIVFELVEKTNEEYTVIGYPETNKNDTLLLKFSTDPSDVNVSEVTSTSLFLIGSKIAAISHLSQRPKILFTLQRALNTPTLNNELHEAFASISANR